MEDRKGNFNIDLHLVVNFIVENSIKILKFCTALTGRGLLLSITQLFLTYYVVWRSSLKPVLFCCLPRSGSTLLLKFTTNNISTDNNINNSTGKANKATRAQPAMLAAKIKTEENTEPEASAERLKKKDPPKKGPTLIRKGVVFGPYAARPVSPSQTNSPAPYHVTVRYGFLMTKIFECFLFGKLLSYIIQ